MIPIHPGRILKRELTARGLSANRLALGLRVPSGRITDILNGKRGITPETALRLARAFGTSADFWMNLQTHYDLAIAKESCRVGKRFLFAHADSIPVRNTWATRCPPCLAAQLYFCGNNTNVCSRV